MLGVGERFVRRLVAEHRIEIIKVGRLFRFDPDVVTAWINDRRRRPAYEVEMYHEATHGSGRRTRA